MNRTWKESLKRGMAGLLAFAMASLLVVGDTGIAFADFASDGLLRDGLSLSEDNDVSGSVVDGVTFKNQERDGVLISVSSETSDFQPGDDVTLHIYVKNESDQVVTDGMLSYEGDGIQKGSGDLAPLGRIDGRGLFAGSDGMEDADLIWDLDENSAQDILETETEAERDGITLEPGEICAAQFTYVVDKSVDEKTAEAFQIDFRFEGIGEDGDVVEEEETFSFNVNYLNVAAPEFEDGNRVKTGETVTMGIHADLAQADAVLTDSWEDASASDAEADESVATPSQADAATSSAETTATASNALAFSATVSVATPSQAGAVRKATTSNAVASDSDADETDSLADEELIDDRKTNLTPVDLSEVRYEVEMYNAKLHGFQAKKAMVDDADNNMLICTYRVSPEVEPGIYFGKITQISETNGRTCESTQGFALIVEGEGNVTLEGRLGHTTVTVSGPTDAFPDADDLEVRVTELDEETQAKVEEAIRRKADEDGETIENYIAVDVSLYANGEEIQPGERVNVTIEYSEDDVTVVGTTADDRETAETESSEENATSTRVYHFNESEQEAEVLDTSREEDGKVTVTTTGFSPMIVATVQSSGSQGNIGDTLDGDYAYLTDVKMVADETTESGYSMRTGTSPWDDDDEAGNDSEDTNNVLRTYDIATYTVTFTSKVREDAPYKVYKEGTLYFEFLLEGTSNEIQYETLSMGWLSAKKDAHYVITEETMEKEDGSTATCQVLRGSYTWEPSEDNDHAIGESTQELTLAIRALALTNGAIIQPQFTFFLEGNEVGVDYGDWGTESYSDGVLTGSQAHCPEHGETEYQTVTPPEVTVSAVASYNVKIISASTSKCQSVGTFDFGTGNELALNQGAGSVYGRMGAYGIVIQITGKSGQGLRGVELPKSGEDITFDLSLASTFTYVDENGDTIVLSLDDGTLDSAYMPLIWSFDANLSESSQQDERAIPVSTRCADTVPLNELGTTGAQEYNSCYDGGDWSIQANEDGTYTVTISGCQINMEQIPYTNQTGNSSSTTYYDPASVEKYWEIDTACISAGEVWIVQPFYQYETDEDGTTTSTYIVDTYGDGTFTTYLQDTSLMMTTESGETLKEVTDNSNQAVTGDDKVGQSMAITKSGSISQNIRYLKFDYSDYQDALTDGCSGTGQDWILMGDQLTIGGWLSHDSAEGGYTGVAYDVLVKFDDVFFEPESIVASGVNGGTVTKMYAAKVDQSGWDHQNLEPDEDGYDTEMKEADIDDLVYFDSLEELEGVGYTCVGVLLQYRGLVTEQMNHIHYYIKGSTKSDADVDYVYMVTHCARAWNREDLAEVSGKSLSDLLVMSRSEVNALVSEYIPTVASGGTPDYQTDYPSSCYWINGGLDGKSTQSSRILAYTKPYYDESGYVSQTEGTLWGDSCLLVGYTTNVTLSVAQTTTGDAEKISFDMDTNQRTVDYVVQGTIERNNGTFDTETTQTTDVTVTVTLPAGLTYLAGSSYIGGTYTSNGEGVQGTVTGGSQLLDGFPVTYTDANGNEITVTLTVTGNKDGTTTLTYQFENFVIGSELTEYLEAIHLSCTIGTIGQEETNVQNNQSLVTTATIESTEDRREQSTANGNLAERGILISKNSAISLVKFADQSVVNVGESMGFTMNVGNNSSSDMEIVAVDALPYDGDGVSHFTGDVVVSEFSVLSENTADLTRLHFYYTLDEDKKGITSEEIEATPGYTESSYFTEKNGWYELSLTGLTEQDSFEATAIAAVGTLTAGTTLRMHITIELPDAESGDYITNTLTRDNLSSTAQCQVVDSSGSGTEEDPGEADDGSQSDPDVPGSSSEEDPDDSDSSSDSDSGSSGGNSGSGSSGSGSGSGSSGNGSGSSGSSVSSTGNGAGGAVSDSEETDGGEPASPSDWREDDVLSRLPKTGDHMPFALLYLTTAVSGILVIVLGTVSYREFRKAKKEKRE